MSFTVPVNWREIPFKNSNEFIGVQFATNIDGNKGVIIDGSRDYWELLSPSEWSGLS